MPGNHLAILRVGGSHTQYGTTVQRTIAGQSRLDEAIGDMFNLPAGVVTSAFLAVQTLGDGPGVHGFVEISSSNGGALTAAPVIPFGFGQVEMLFSQVSQGAGYWTGLALANPSQTGATATIELYSPAGVLVASTTVTLDPGQHRAGLVSDFFPAVTSQVGGSLRVTASQPIFGMEVFGNAATGNAFMSLVPPGR